VVSNQFEDRRYEIEGGLLRGLKFRTEWWKNVPTMQEQLLNNNFLPFS